MFDTWSIQDWIIIGGLLGNAVMHFIHKFNDLRHVQQNQGVIIEELKQINKRLDSYGERISHIEGRLNGSQK